MEIHFKTRRLEKRCNNQKASIQEFGPKIATKLHQRLWELSAAKSLNDISRLPPARLHLLSGNRKNQFSVDLVHPYRLLFVPANEPVPTLPDGGLDIFNITEIEIIAIEDTH